AYMSQATRGMEVEQFPPPAWVGNQQKFATPPASPSPSQTPQCEPGQMSTPEEPCRERREERPCIRGNFPPGCRPQQTPGPDDQGDQPPSHCQRFPQWPGCSGPTATAEPPDPGDGGGGGR